MDESRPYGRVAEPPLELLFVGGGGRYKGRGRGGNKETYAKGGA